MKRRLLSPREWAADKKKYGVLLGLAGIALLVPQPSCLVATWRVTTAARESPSWPTAPGRILESMVTRHGQLRYRPKVLYAYTVDGAQWTSELIAFDRGLSPGMSIDPLGGTATQSTTGRLNAEATVARFPKGAVVPVSYRPGSPAMACLLPGSTRLPWDYLGVVLGLAAGGVLLGVSRHLLFGGGEALPEEANPHRRRKRRRHR